MKTENCVQVIVLRLLSTILFLSVIVSPMSNELNGTFGLRQGRWGIFFTYEPICTLACQKNGKYSGRMYGGVCRCYCPRSDTDPCSGNYPSCDRLCRQNAYHLGGDCIDEQSCWCYCTVQQRQAPNATQTTTAGTTAAPPSSPIGSSNTLGLVGQENTGSGAGGGGGGKKTNSGWKLSSIFS